MSTKITLNLTGKDFLIACRLFDIDPTGVAESIISNISLVRYCSIQPDSEQGELIRLATDYFMEHAMKAPPQSLTVETIKRLSDKYIALLTDLSRKLAHPEAREQHARVLVYRWLEEVCAVHKNRTDKSL